MLRNAELAGLGDGGCDWRVSVRSYIRSVDDDVNSYMGLGMRV